MKKSLLYFLLFLTLPSMFLMAENNDCESLMELEANPDIVAVLPTEPVTFNVLDNDIGEGIFIKQISKPPPCGSVQIVDASMGILHYIPDDNFDMKIISFEYEVEDNEGNTINTIVKIVKDDVEKDLIVVTEKDCSMTEENGLYILTVTIAKGTPPFLITGTLNTTLDDISLITKPIQDGIPYEINVVDGNENSLFASGGEIGCTKLYTDIDIETLDEFMGCTCNGEMIIDFNTIQNLNLGNIYGFWYEEENSHPIQLGDTIPNTAFIEIFEIGIDCYYHKVNFEGASGFQGNVSNFCPNNTPTPIQIIDDFANTLPNESVTINVLTNDTGTNLQINAINLSPSCGEIADINPETGEIVYIPDADTECGFDVFVYEVVDECGNLEEAAVTVFIEQPESDFIVHVERDCCLVENTGYYTLSVAIFGGEPPFTISGSINEVLEEAGTVSVEINDGQPYEITVTDANNHEYFDAGGQTSCAIFGYRTPIENVEDIMDCTCEGDIIITFETLEGVQNGDYVWGEWTNENQEMQQILVGDTIPSDAYFEISSVGLYLISLLEDGKCYGFAGEVSDYCASQSACTKAIADLVNTASNESITFNVLENDIGIGLSIKQITKPPFCGTVEIIDAAMGTLQYTLNESCTSNLVNFDYQIEDEFGGLAEGEVKVVIDDNGEENDLVVVVERDCCQIPSSWHSYTFPTNILIVEGTPPFTLSGTIDTVLNQTGIFRFFSNNSYEISIVDDLGNEFSETGSESSCQYLCPKLRIDTEILLEEEVVECLCDGSMIVHLDIFGNNEIIESIYGFWYSDNENHPHPLEVGDTIPSNAYLEIFEIQTNRDQYALYTDESDFFGIHSSEVCSLTTPTLNESESQTSTCGAPIVLSVEGGGEGVTYNWYWDEGGLLPATPPTGQVWTNDELVGTGTVYVVAEGCQSEPLAIETTRYEELKAENVAIEVKFPECQEYKVSFTITGGNGNYTINGIPSLADYEDSEWRSPEEDYYFEIDDNNQIFSCPAFIAAGSSPDIDCFFALVNDYAVATVGESKDINVLQNDTGSALFVSNIVESPTCGEITNIDAETGIITYQPFEDTNCTQDSFIYEATQIDGSTMTATVYIFINNGNNDLVVEIERDCTDAGFTGFYTLKITISGGFTPYTIFGSVNEILEASGDMMTILLSDDGSPFEIGVADAVGNEFYETGGELTCCELIGEEIILNLNESESQTSTCGDPIILSIEGDGEETTFNWYWDAEATIPANPPTGQVWTNDELIGVGTIYVIATDTNGCQSEPLAIETTRYEALEVNNIQTVLSESCLEYQVVGIISGGNGEYTANGIPTLTEFRSDWMTASTEDYSFEIDDNNEIFSCPSILIEGDAPDGDCYMQAIEDFATARAGETVEIDVLQNDSGYKLTVSAILQEPTCGTISNIDPETGIITYQANTDTECNTDYFVYQITDHWGDVTQAGVTIFIPKENNELVVEIDTDCANSDITGVYTLNLTISNGTPPFTISGSINEVLENYAYEFAILPTDVPYEIHVIDGQGQEFTTSNNNPCFNEELCIDLQITPTYDCLITQAQDSIALLTYQTTGGDGNYTFNGNTQNDTLQNGDIYQIEVIDGNGCTAIISDTIACNFTSIENPNLHTSIPNIYLFPNPNNGNFTLSLELKQAEEIEMEIIDIVGRVKTRRHLNPLSFGEGKGEVKATFEREDLKSGLYFIRVSGKNWIWTEKMVVE